MFGFIKNRRGNNKGITLVLLAFMIFLLLGLAALAIDFAYFYVVKNELQAAADAAALAGAARLDGTLQATAARSEAVLFAGKNTAAGIPVVLASNNSNALSAANDITVGYWDGTTYTPNATPVNALQARPRRTSGSPGGQVGVIFGPVLFDKLGMDISASAVAAFTTPRIQAFPVCLPSCDLRTPLNGQWGFDKNPKYGNHPIESTDEDTAADKPPGQQFFLGRSETNAGVRQPGLAWTNFFINVCDVNPACNMPNPNEIIPYIKGEQNPPADLCNKRICSTNGTMGTVLQALEDEFNKNKRQHTFTVGNVTLQITGWEVFIPVLSDQTCGPASPCPGAQAEAANPYRIDKFVRLLVTEVIKTGSGGIRVVGFNNPTSYTFTYRDDPPGPGGPIDVTKTRIVTTFGCMDCPSAGGLPPQIAAILKLVK